MNVAALLQDSPSEERNSKRNNNSNWTQQQTQQSPASQARLNPSTASTSDSSRGHVQHPSAGPTTPTTSLHASPAMASLRPIQDRPPTSSTSTHPTANFPGMNSGTTTSAGSGAGSPSASSVTAWAPPHPGSSSFMSQSASVHNMERAQDREKRITTAAPAATQTLVGPGTQGFASGGIGEFFFIFIKFPRFFFCGWR